MFSTRRTRVLLCLLAVTVTCSVTAGVANAAPVNTALPTISGVAQQGQVLTLHQGTWTDATTLTIVDVWETCAGTACSAISPPPGATYTMTAADVGHTVRVVETATAADGAASVTALAPPGIVTLPSITGTAQEGNVLTLIQGQWSNSPSITNQWEHCDIAGLNCQPVSGATGTTYAVGATDVGFTIKVLETATNTGGTATASTNPTFVVVAPPTEISAPSISGVPSQGSLLSENHGTWTGSPTSYLYQWERCINGACTAILGANSPTYVPTPLDVGAGILVAETAINIGGPSAAAHSPVTGAVTTPAGIVPVPASISPPTVSGVARQGQTLLEANGTWSNNPNSYSYQWASCGNGRCTPIPGATAQAYTPTANDVGHAIVVLETATNSGGNSSPATTAQTAVVSATSATSLAVSTGAPRTNQPVTLVATITSSSGNADPAGQLTFFDGKHPIGGCANKALRAAGQSVTLICQSSFPAGTAGLTAVYTPSAGSLVGSSASPLTNLNVRKDPTSTSLAVTKQVARNKPAIYAATVILPVSNSGPIAPVGSIEFLDHGRPIAACAHRPLKKLAATCVLKYSSLNAHKISARYTGDSNFASSRSPTRSVQVVVHSSRPIVLGFISSTLQWQFHYHPSYTVVTELRADGVARGTTILITCAGGGCPFARSSIRTKTDGSIDLLAAFRKRHLRAGSQITLRITRPNWIGKYYAFTVRSGRGPLIFLSCLGVGGSGPGQGC